MRWLLTLFLGLWGLLWPGESMAQGTRLTNPPRAWENQHLPYETWASMMFQVENSQPEAEEGFVTSFFEDRPQQQFGRRFWIPGESILQGWYLAQTPPAKENAPDPGGATLRSMLIRQQGSIESASVADPNQRSEDTPIRLRKQAFRTWVLADPDDEETARLVIAARMKQADPKAILSSPLLLLPPEPAAYEQWTHIVLAMNRVLEDPAGLEAIRQWVVQGGRLWILLDKTGPEIIPPFLADAASLAVIDRVGLTSFSLESASAGFQTGEELRDWETPVDLVRIVPEGFKTLCESSGWPAALVADVGEGKVFVTALAPRGWLQTREQAGFRRWPIELADSSYPTLACQSLGEEIWAAEIDEEPAQEPIDLPELAARHVGYRITSLQFVVWVLAGFCLGALLLTLLLWRWDRLTWFSWTVPLAAVTAALTLGISAYRTRTAIPPTEATLQIAEADSLGQIQIEGGLSVNSAANGDTQPKVTRGGQLEFVTPPAGVAKRFVQTDLGMSRWENLDLNTGMHGFRMETSVTGQPSQAVLSLNETGLVGKITNPQWKLPEHGLLYWPRGGWAAPRFLEQGAFVSQAGDGLARGQYSARKLIDDREAIRVELLRQHFADARQRLVEPRFYFWATPFETGLHTQTEGRSVGDALVGLPVIFERPAAGSPVFCPDYLLPYRSIPFPRRGASLSYVNRSGTWNELLSRKSSTTLEFQLPAPLGRFRLERLRVRVDINAPNRDFQMLALDPENLDWQPKLAERNSPVGLLEFEIAGDQLPPLNDDLTFVLGFDVGPRADDPQEREDDDSARHAWQFRNLWVEAWGTVLEE